MSAIEYQVVLFMSAYSYLLLQLALPMCLEVYSMISIIDSSHNWSYILVIYNVDAPQTIVNNYFNSFISAVISMTTNAVSTMFKYILHQFMY